MVVAVVGILSSIAIPSYMNYLAKSQQVEAQSNLGAIYVGMLAYSAPLGSNGFEGATLDKIGFSSDGMERYSYELVSVGKINFLARALGISGQVSGDIWEMDETEFLNDLDPGFDK